MHALANNMPPFKST